MQISRARSDRSVHLLRRIPAPFPALVGLQYLPSFFRGGFFSTGNRFRLLNAPPTGSDKFITVLAAPFQQRALKSQEIFVVYCLHF